MTDTVILIISATLSALLFNFIFYKLNCKFKLFEGIRSKIDNLNEEKKHKLRVISYVMVIIVFLVTHNMNSLMQGLTFGLFTSFRDICFKDTFIESIK